MKIWAVDFASADVPRLSSITPRPAIAVHVTRAASGSALPPFIAGKNGRDPEAPSARGDPRDIPRPPLAGVAFGCTPRSDGCAMAPHRTTSGRTSGGAPH